MIKPFRKILAIARTEFRFGYRRAGPAFLALIGSLAVTAGTVFYYSDLIPNRTECLQAVSTAISDPERVATAVAGGIPIPAAEATCDRIISEDYQLYTSVYVAHGLHASWFPFLLFSLVFVTAASASAVPADRQYAASEWLRSLPIDGNVYLLGKILGMFASALAGSLIPLALFVPITLILMRTLPVGLMLALAALDGLPVLLWSAAFGVLIGVPFQNRMKAAMTGVVLGLFCLIDWLYVFYSPYGKGNTFDTASYYVFQQFGLEVGMPWHVSVGQVEGMYLGLLAAACLLGLAARQWLKWRENF